MKKVTHKSKTTEIINILPSSSSFSFALFPPGADKVPKKEEKREKKNFFLSI